MTRLLFVVVLAAVACEPAASTSSTSPAITATAAPSATPSSTVVVTTATPSPITATAFTPRLILSVPYATRTDALGATTGRVGGLNPRGVSTFAIDEQDRIFIWDQARLRIAVFEGGKLTRAIPAPYVEQKATQMLVDGGRVYLRFTEDAVNIAYEIDATTGRLLQTQPSGDLLYPRARAKDAFGNGYGTDLVGAITRYVRADPLGRTVAYAVEPLSLKGVDLYARRDGSLFELASDFGGQGSAYVYALMPAAGTAPVATPRAVSPAPTAFGERVPDRLTATVTGGGTADVDANTTNAFWWVASTAALTTTVTTPTDGQFTAWWGERIKYINAAYLNLGDLDHNYRTSTHVWGQVAGYAAAAPSRLASLIGRSGATIRIADLRGTERALTAADVTAVTSALGAAFSVSEGELPGDLELPFPIYEIVSGETVIQLRRDRYASVSRLGAFAHDGALYDAARRIMPVPSLSIDDPRSLFLATSVKIAEDGYPDRTQDISRWKASLVRDLTATGPYTNGYTDTNPLTLTFTLPARTETVRVTQDAYVYRGITYPRQGIIGIVGYRGVP